MTAALTTLGLAVRLFRRTLGAKYRKSFLGYFWMVAPALAVTGAVTLASEAGVVKPGELPLPYPLFAFLGTLLWQAFADAIDVPHQAFEGARSYLTRVPFPRSAVVLAQLLEALSTTAVRAAAAAVCLLLVQGLSWAGLGWLLAAFAVAVLLGAGLGAWLMPWTQLFADLHQTQKLVLQYGLFLSPAVYTPAGDGLFAALVRWNPTAPLMDAARQAAGGLEVAAPLVFAAVALAAVLLLGSGLWLVQRIAPILVERMLLGGR